MKFPVTLATESDQVVLSIRALMVFESHVMNLDCGERRRSRSKTSLRSSRYALASKRTGGTLRPDLAHAAWLTCWRKSRLSVAATTGKAASWTAAES